MAQVIGNRKEKGVIRSLDYWTIIIYIALLTFGWVSVCGASYSYGDTDLFSLDTRSGMQIVWIGTSIVLGFVILMLDDRYLDMFAYIIFGVMLILLFGTIFNPHSIKGSRSWLVLGPVRLQPAEFAKFATALALAKLMNTYGFNIGKWKDFGITLAVIFIPMLFIVMQRETGSALVYLSFFLMLYREGMPGSILFTGVAMVVYFVVGIRFADVMLSITPTSVGLVYVYCNDKRDAIRMTLVGFLVTLIALIFALFIIPFDVNIVETILCVAMVIYLLYRFLATRFRNYLWITAFALGSLLFYNVADYGLNHVLEPHQRVRINVLLGLEEDLKGAGYNVHQSEIAIGSGGLQGKGFLNGTQTKLKYVPEQDTDFIFCTVGEEEGFVGSAGVLLLFLALIWRLIHLAERQVHRFGRVYGYCVVSVFLFHVFINVGMVLGLTPVIGIPLPFFSYGGSSLWGFTLLLFIFLRIDAGRNLLHN